MRVGDLVKYRDQFTSRRLIGVILQVENDEGFACSPYRVRWTDHTESQRNWYDLGELRVISESRRFSREQPSKLVGH